MTATKIDEYLDKINKLTKSQIVLQKNVMTCPDLREASREFSSLQIEIDATMTILELGGLNCILSV